MKKSIFFTCIIMILISYIQSSYAQQAFYIYRNDGGINTFITTEIDSMTYSCLDLDSVAHEDFVVHEVYTPDSIYRIPIELIDSVGFVTPETVYQPGVRVLEGEMRNYIASSNELSLIFLISTPNKYLPHVGDKLVTTVVDDVIPRAFVGQVSEINTTSNGIEVMCSPVDLTEIFETYYGITKNTDETRPLQRSVADGFYGTYGTKNFNPGNLVLDIFNSHNVSIAYNKDDELSYSLDNARATVTFSPIIKYNAYLIVNKAYGVNLSISAVGNYNVEELFSLSGNIEYNFEFPFLKKTLPIPEALIDVEFEMGFFGQAQGIFSIDQIWYQNYKHLFHWEWSSKGHETIQKTHTIKNPSNTHTGKVALNGSIGIGAYGKIGIAFIATSSLDIAEVGLKYQVGLGIEGTYVPYKRDENYAKRSTDLYNQIKDREIGVYRFRGLEFEAKLFKWSVSKEIPNFANIPFNQKEIMTSFRSVPLFTNTKLKLGESGVYGASTLVTGNVLPTDVGFALINQDNVEDAIYTYTNYDYIGPKVELYSNFYNIPISNKYTVFPLVKYLGMELIAEPSDEIYVCPDEKHPHMIDLGLPSGTKWACCNIGATRPEQFGGYYAWGETSEKDNYTISTYSYNIGYDDNIEWGYTNIGTNICGTGYDAALSNWGAPWLMPNNEDIIELIKYTNYEGTLYNGVEGILFRSICNNKKIFLPFAGDKTENYTLDQRPSFGHYWTGCISDDRNYNQWETYRWLNTVCALYIGKNGSYYVDYTRQNHSPSTVTYGERPDGLTIRAVCK